VCGDNNFDANNTKQYVTSQPVYFQFNRFVYHFHFHVQWLDSAAVKFRRHYDLLNAIRALQHNAESALQRQITNRLAYRHYRRTLLVCHFIFFGFPECD
jgi:hypothetical protein